ncbi:hypothetical protein [Novosphingobium mangrovi (ex Huang et al. 2023)]|uniref:Flippase-like domain-containing protein n=1 Tax=Novosphingobium mangrovi (ex Huang et al. 2023) TaxID=2976432 RepID=A0ABT2I419_9SPHN|nr:hypothetical protein [Novosphingobium mangrovi (ex Huang et al. 2023)]MCT2399557.1 hypothetical protein [Novosphingobium mangrovi (ex Huang et al. 2023)]
MSDPSAALAPNMPNLDAPPAIELTPQDRNAHPGRKAIFSVLLSIGVIVAVIHEMDGLNVTSLLAMVPRSAAFWLFFAASYLITPASEWLIFHRLWRIPPAGFVALLRKKVYNELLLGYLGEAYFYTWARRRVALEAAPFGAVKDVAILSAITGNAVTIALLVIMLPMLGDTGLGIDTRMFALSLGVILAISMAAMIFRKRVFTLTRSDLMMITRTHLARIVLSTVLLAVVWHLVLPAVPLTWWLYLSTLRLLVSRLPLMPNKDLLFAGIAVMMLGHERDIGALMTLMAGLILATHLVLGSVIAINDLTNPEKRA